MSKKCNCWHEKDDELRKRGFKISDACSVFEVTKDLNLKATFCLPLKLANGARPGRKDPKCIFISHCPFCGKKL